MSNPVSVDKLDLHTRLGRRRAFSSPRPTSISPDGEIETRKDGEGGKMAEEKKEEMQETQTTETETQEAEQAVEPQVSIEDLKKEIERKEGEILRLQGLTRDLQKRGISTEVLDSFSNRMANLEEGQAMLMDMLEEKLGESIVEEPKTRKTHLEQLRESRAETQRGRETTVPPDVQRFFSYCDMADLHVDYGSFENCDPLVKEALGEGRGFREGLQYLKAKVKAKNEENVKKQFEQARQEIREQILKEYGLTASEAGGPSGSGQPTIEELDKMPADKYAEWRRKNK